MIELNLPNVLPIRVRPVSHPPTPEQQIILGLARTDGILKVIAGAGTGKTSTLVMSAEQDLRSTLYMAFNKAMAMEATHRMPEHVTCATTHSVAYGFFGRELSNAGKLSRPEGGYVNVKGTGKEVAIAYKLRGANKIDGSPLPPSVVGNDVLNTVARFEQSADERLDERHITINEHVAPGLFPVYRRVVLDAARRLWDERIDFGSNTLATHDTYLKLFQLSKNPMASYKVVMLDEAQDTNACVLDIFNTMSAPQKLLVGDPYQQIYAWRGSVNAMAQVEAREAYLTESFRFGQEVADVANAILRMYGPSDFELKGRASTRIVERDEVPSPCTCLFRTNAGLLGLGMELIPQGHAVELNTDVKDLVRLVEAAIAIRSGNMNGVKHQALMPYNSWAEIEDESETSPELARLVKLEVDYGLHTVVEILKAYKKPPVPSIVLTTAHKSKGLEWDNVMLANDFRELDRMNEEERNLLYVAVTRAKKLLTLNDIVGEILAEEED